MKKQSKGLALLLALMMLISMNPVIAFAEAVQPDAAAGAGEGMVLETDKVTPEDVHESLDTAITSELDTAVEFFPSSETWDEIGAAVNDAAAGQALSDAEQIVEDANEQTAEAANTAENSKDKAADAATNAEGWADTAEQGQQYAEQQQAKAEDPDTSKEDADTAANLAGVAAAGSQIAADAAFRNAETAATEADKAKAAYEEAQKAYEAAKKDVDEKLAQGLIDAKEAADLTAAAAEKADLTYQKWVDLKSQADAAAAEAKDTADNANKELDERIDELNVAIEKTSKDVGTAAVTGSALAAAKIAAGASRLEVSYYEGRIKIEEAKIDYLNEKIADAEAKIGAAEAVLAIKAAALDKADKDYETKKAELEEAKENLDLARKAVEDVKAIIEQRDESGIRAQLNQVRTGDYCADDVHDVAEYLMDKNPDLEWDALESDVFSIGDQLYKVSVFEVIDNETGELIDRIVNINEYFPDEYEAIEALPDAEKEWKGGDEAGIQETDMRRTTAKYGEGPVYLKKDENGEFSYVIKHTNGYYYTVQEDEKGFFVINKAGKRVDLVIEAPKVGDQVADTSKIAEAWDDATEKEIAAVTAETTCKGAESAENLAALVLAKAKIEYDVVDADLKAKEAKKSVLVKRHDKHVEHVKRLDSKLNTENWDPTEEQEKNITDAIQAVVDGQFTFGTVKLVGKVLLDFNIPAKARGFVTDVIHDLSKKAHHEAVEEVKTDVETVGTTASATADAAANAVQANKDLAFANVTKAFVDKKAQEAERTKAAADQAKVDAAIAYEDYQNLAAAYGPNADNVVKAENAYLAAKNSAEAAQTSADKAQTAYEAAQKAFMAARAAADAKVEPSPTPDPSPAPAPTPAPTVDPQNNGNSTAGNAAVSGNGYTASTSTSKTNTGDNNKAFAWLSVLATAGLALTKGLVSRLRAQN